MDNPLDRIFTNLWNRIISPYSFIKNFQAILSFSGGKDSRIVLEFYNYLHRNYNIPKPIVFHLAHNIRETSQEKLEIQDLLLSLNDGKNYFRSKNIPKLSKRIKKSLEETGRIVRKNELNKIAKSHNAYLVTGHHAKDYIETVLINLIRDSGTNFTTMPTWDGNIFRPLTLLTDAELNDCYKYISNVQIWEDETNQSDLYFRNRIRKNIVPLLEKEGIKFDRVYQNLHDDVEHLNFEEICPQMKEDIPSFISIAHSTCSIIHSPSLWKKTLDLHLRLISLSPARGSTVRETFKFLQEKKSFEYRTKEFLLSKQTLGPAFIIPFNSSCYDEPQIDFSESKLQVSWNQQVWSENLSQEDGYHIGFIQDGLRIAHNKSMKEVSEIFRENTIPKSIRKYIPIVFKKNEAILILLSLWNPELQNFPKDWKK